MKKKYIIPTLTVVKIQTQQILATSAEGLDGFGGYKGNGGDDDYGD